MNAEQKKATSIMVVEDYQFTQDLIVSILRDGGYTVIDTANSGLSAIRKYKELWPDLVTMDMNMPGMNGLQAITALKEINPDIKILAITGYRDIETKAREMGARGFLQKPFQPDHLFACIEELLREKEPIPTPAETRHDPWSLPTEETPSFTSSSPPNLSRDDIWGDAPVLAPKKKEEESPIERTLPTEAPTPEALPKSLAREAPAVTAAPTAIPVILNGDDDEDDLLSAPVRSWPRGERLDYRTEDPKENKEEPFSEFKEDTPSTEEVPRATMGSLIPKDEPESLSPGPRVIPIEEVPFSFSETAPPAPQAIILSPKIEAMTPEEETEKMPEEKGIDTPEEEMPEEGAGEAPEVPEQEVGVDVEEEIEEEIEEDDEEDYLSILSAPQEDFIPTAEPPAIVPKAPKLDADRPAPTRIPPGESSGRGEGVLIKPPKGFAPIVSTPMPIADKTIDLMEDIPSWERDGAPQESTPEKVGFFKKLKYMLKGR